MEDDGSPISEDHLLSTSSEQEWTAEMQVALFQAMSRCRPVGVHKHFRMLYVQRYLNNHMGTRFTTDQIWAFLDTLFDFNQLDVLADEDDEGSVTRISPLPGFISASLGQDATGDLFKYPIEFMLPLEDFEEIIDKKRKAGTVSPLDLPASRRARSKTPALDSTLATPQPQRLRATRSRNASISSSNRGTPDPSHSAEPIHDVVEEETEESAPVEETPGPAPKSTRKKPGPKKKEKGEFTSPEPVTSTAKGGRRTRASIAATPTPSSGKKKKK